MIEQFVWIETKTRSISIDFVLTVSSRENQISFHHQLSRSESIISVIDSTLTLIFNLSCRSVFWVNPTFICRTLHHFDGRILSFSLLGMHNRIHSHTRYIFVRIRATWKRTVFSRNHSGLHGRLNRVNHLWFGREWGQIIYGICYFVRQMPERIEKNHASNHNIWQVDKNL